MKTHLSKYAGETCLETLAGPVVIEMMEPLCGVQPDEPLYEETSPTCLKCQAFLRKYY